MKNIGFYTLLVVIFFSGCPSSPPASNNVLPPRVNALSTVETSVLDRIGKIDTQADILRALAVFEEPGISEKLLPEERTIYAAVLLSLGRKDDSQKQYELVLTESPANPDALRSLALFAELEGKNAEQLGYIDQWIKSSPHDPEAYAVMGWAYLNRHDIPKATSNFDLSLSKGRNALASAGKSQIQSSAGKNQEALTSIEDAISLDPENDQWHSLRSLILVDLERPQEAERAITQALTLSPENPWHLLDRARLRHRVLYKPQAALEDLNKLIGLDSQNFFGFVYRAEILEAEGRWQDSYKDYKVAYALKPEYDSIFPSMSLMSFLFEDYALAVQMASASFQANRGEWAFPVIQAISLRKLRREPEAAQVLTQNSERFSGSPLVSELFRFLQNPRASQAFLGLIERETDPVNKSRVQFYAGYQFYTMNQNQSARALFREVSEQTLKNIPEIDMAKIMMRKF